MYKIRWAAEIIYRGTNEILRKITQKESLQMDSVIISTKNTNTKYKNTGIARAVLICLVGILIICGCFFLDSHSSGGSLTVLLIGLFLFCGGIITAVLRLINASSYVDIYGDRLVGRGIRNFSPLDFNLKSAQVTGISVVGIRIHIHSRRNIQDYDEQRDSG